MTRVCLRKNNQNLLLGTFLRDMKAVRGKVKWREKEGFLNLTPQPFQNKKKVLYFRPHPLQLFIQCYYVIIRNASSMQYTLNICRKATKKLKE